VGTGVKVGVGGRGVGVATGVSVGGTGVGVEVAVGANGLPLQPDRTKIRATKVHVKKITERFENEIIVKSSSIPLQGDQPIGSDGWHRLLYHLRRQLTKNMDPSIGFLAGV
jgi:hypothetical protein